MTSPRSPMPKTGNTRQRCPGRTDRHDTVDGKGQRRPMGQANKGVVARIPFGACWISQILWPFRFVGAVRFPPRSPARDLLDLRPCDACRRACTSGLFEGLLRIVPKQAAKALTNVCYAGHTPREGMSLQGLPPVARRGSRPRRHQSPAFC